MHSYPDGNIALPLIHELAAAGTAATDIDLGPDTQFIGLRFAATADDTVVLWRPSTGEGDEATLAASSAYRVGLASDGDAWDGPILPVTQRPSVLRVRVTAGAARIEVLRVVAQ